MKTMKNKKKIILSIILACLILVMIAALSIALGTRRIPFSVLMQAVSGNVTDEISVESAAIAKRIPRMIFGIIAGGALGVSGTLMQSITRNPVADPSILGVNTGASLFVVAGLAFFNITSAGEYIWLSIIGAAVTAALVYGVASIGNGGATPLKLALAGTAASTALGSLLSAVLLPADSHVMDSFRFWQVGSIGGANWGNIRLLLPFFSVGLILAVFLSPRLNALALGDEMAVSLGVNVRLVRGLSALAGVLLCGATTALAGPIGFVGLMVPHMVRHFFGSDLKILMPMSAIGGAGLLLLADVIGRLIGGAGETEVGIVTAFIGAPIFIGVIRKAKVRSI